MALARRALGSEGWLATMISVRARDAATSSGISAASGRFFQYRLGISPCMVWVFSRAGLKVEA